MDTKLAEMFVEQTDDFIKMCIRKYYLKREDLKIPNPEDALHFLVSEVGELSDAFVEEKDNWGRNNPDKIRSIEDEVGDVLMMLYVFAMLSGISPILSMVKKHRRKLGLTSDVNDGKIGHK